MSARRHTRLAREQHTIEVMVAMYCHDHHLCGQAAVEQGAGSRFRRSGRSRADRLCPECDELLAYARRRVVQCRYGSAKPTCAKCTNHCYKPEMRERVRAVMRYSGPRMLKRHPLLAAAHLADSHRRGPRRSAET